MVDVGLNLPPRAMLMPWLGPVKVIPPLQLSGTSAVPPVLSIPEMVVFSGELSSFEPLHTAPVARTSVHGTLEPAITSWLNVCAADQVLACPVEGTAAPPTVSAPVTAVLPVTVRLPLSESENALMPLVVVSEVNVGALGSFGKITLGSCLVVMPGPLISIM